MKIAVFYIPTGSAEEAYSLSNLAIQNHLAACSNVFPVDSFFLWEGQLQQDHEFVLILKTMPEAVVDLQSFLEKHHSYTIPCIMHWETEVNDAYGKWMQGLLTGT